VSALIVYSEAHNMTSEYGSEQNKIIVCISIMIVTCVITVSSMTVSLYRAELRDQQERLTVTAESMARLIESLVLHEIRDKQKNGYAMKDDELSDFLFPILISAHDSYKGFGETGEITLGRLEGSTIRFILRHRKSGLSEPHPVDLASAKAEPMRRALRGKRGVVLDKDYRGEMVLAAYEPISVMNLGIVSKIDLREFMQPYIYSGVMTGLVGVLLILGGSFVFLKLGNDLIRTLRLRSEKLEIEIQQRSAVETVLRVSERNYRTLAENITDQITRYDHQYRYLFQNQAAYKACGIEERDLIGKTHRELGLDEQLCSVWDKNIREVFSSGELVESSFKWYSPQGSKYLNIRVYPELNEHGDVETVIGVLSDLTKQKMLEEDLKNENDIKAVLLDNLSDGVIACDEEEKLTLFNKTAQNWHQSDSLDVPPESWATYYNLYEEDGVTSLASDAIPLRRAFRGEEFDSVPLAIARDGEAPRFIVASGGPVMDENENRIGAVITMHDVTHRKALEDELLKTEKLEAVGILAGGIAQDLNNYLTALVCFIDLARESDNRENANQNLAYAVDSIKKISDVTQKLLTYSEGGAQLREKVDLGKLVFAELNMVLTDKKIKHYIKTPADSYPVSVEKNQIRQVFSNIIVNAVEAMPGGGRINVSLDIVELTAIDALPLPDGNYYKISIEDSGPGILYGIRANVFDPFFTTKPNHSGLGLATAYSIIKRHSGYIRLNSDEDAGAKFEIYIPAPRIKAQKNSGTTNTTGAQRESRILVMDDQEEVRRVVKSALKKIGCVVTTSSDGSEAIEKYKEAMYDGTGFDVVILDLTIPGGVGGGETIKKLTQIDPDVIAVVASGYSDDAIMVDCQKYGFKKAIAKPYTIQILREEIQQLLNDQRRNNLPPSSEA